MLNFHESHAWNSPRLDLNESSDINLSELIIAYVKSTIVFQKTGREPEVFEVANFMNANFDLGDPLPCRNGSPYFGSL